MAKKVVRKKSKGTVVSSMKQEGTSVKSIDKRMTAIGPGKRRTTNPHYHRGKIVRKSTTYTEKRANRSDKGRSGL